MLQNDHQYTAYHYNKKVTENRLNYAYQLLYYFAQPLLIDKDAPYKIHHHALLIQSVHSI